MAQSFVTQKKTKINHHQQQQHITPLTFSDTAILDNELGFPEQRQSFVSTQESIIAHALLLLLIAIISLLTKIIHSYVINFKNKKTNKNNPESPTAQEYNNQQATYPVNYHAPNENLNMYPQQSRLLSPIDNDPRWESYAEECQYFLYITHLIS